METIPDELPEAGCRTATVTGGGRSRERNMHTYGEWLANYEKSHRWQLENIIRMLAGQGGV